MHKMYHKSRKVGDKPVKRMMITMSDELAARLEEYSAKTGVPKSTACTMWVASALDGMDIAKRAIERSLEKNTAAAMKSITKGADDL